jgi:hypothetical protein
MTASGAANPEVMKEAKLSRADWVLLPLVSLLTVGLLATSTELIARQMFSESQTGVRNCMVLNDPSTGPRGIPNTTCWEKSPESQWVDYRFNRCGHRAGMECGPKSPDVYRIVMNGASMAMGEHVQREKTFAALLPGELSQLTGRKVEVYNEGMGWGFSHSVALRFNQVLAANPDMILWILTPIDVERTSLVLPTGDLDPYAGLSLPAKAWRRAKDTFTEKSLSVAAADVFGHSRTALMLRHVLYQSQSQSIKSFLMAPDGVSGFLRTELSPEWEMRLKMFDRDAADMEGEATKAGVPFVAVFVPIRAQAAMISMGEWPAGFDPYKLNNRLRSIIVSHGGTFLDISPGFRNIPNPERYFFPVDTHPTAEGNEVISEVMARVLTCGVVPALKASTQPQAALGQVR